MPLSAGRDDVAEERTIERVDPGRGEREVTEAEGEDGILAVASVVVRPAVAGQDGQVGLAAKRFSEGPEELVDRSVEPPGILEPALGDLGVGPTVDPAVCLECAAARPVVAQVPA